MAWLDKEGLPKAPDLWELYVKGLNLDTDPFSQHDRDLDADRHVPGASMLRGYFKRRYYNRKQAAGS